MAARTSRVSEPENPFRIGGVVTGRHFTDRAAERRAIGRALTEPQGHLLVFGPRRMGKTSTLCAVQADLVRGHRHVVMADLSTGSTLADMTNRVLRAATSQLGRRWADVLPALLKRLNLKVSVSPDFTGTMVPSLDVSIREAPQIEQGDAFVAALDAIDHLAAAKQAHVGVILDEFQELHRFGGEAMEAQLRGAIQTHRHVSYVLAGSDERLIRAMTSARRPLYKLLEPLELAPIEAEHLARWIDERLRAAGVEAAGIGARIVEVAGPRTRDVVQLARGTFEVSRRTGQATLADVEEALRQIVLAEDAPTRSIWESLSPLQQNVLRALAVSASGLTTRVTRRQFSLGETGPATKAAQTLVGRDLLVKSPAGYEFDSPFFRAWVIVNTLADVGLSRPISHLPRDGDQPR
jgi:hypothetical protein